MQLKGIYPLDACICIPLMVLGVMGVQREQRVLLCVMGTAPGD